MPSVGHKKGTSYVKTWQMEPLAIAVLSALTPAGVQKHFYDDRFEIIPEDDKPDLVAINIETYTARRAYQIAALYRAKGVPIVMGGFHASLCPDEVQEHADTVVTGSAESVWEQVVEDCRAQKLQSRYNGEICFVPVLPDRAIYSSKKYMPLVLLEAGRGCCFACEFCSICAFFKHRYLPRPLDDVQKEITETEGRLYFFIDDNLAADKEHFTALLKRLIPLSIRWVGQVSIDTARDETLLDLMQASGCIGVLIGFESLEQANLGMMNKKINRKAGNFSDAIAGLRRHSIAVYATFVFGYDLDTEETFRRTLDFALKERFFFTAFNHLVPFPGTPLYERLLEEKRLTDEKWWLNGSYRFGDVAFHPAHFSPAELAAMCLKYRKKFYSLSSIIRRSLDFRANISDPLKFLIFWSQAFINRGDIDRRQGLPLGQV